MKRSSRIIALALLLCTLLGMLPMTVLAEGVAKSTANTEDAMTAIEADLGQYKDGTTKTVANDGYIGIPVDVSVYRDTAKPVIRGDGVNATPVVIYVVNTMAERVGTDSDTEIITSMIERGYVVVVFDYKNNAKAISPDLEYSVQKLRTSVTNGAYISEITKLPSGNYTNNMVVPAGNNIEFNLIFWEFDKHGADGTFDKIVEVWNNDFRSWKGERVIKWVDDNGNRKATQTAFDGSAPVWYDDSGAANVDTDGNGQYIKIKHTKTTVVTDCVKADGTPIDMNLYMHVIYPTNPEGDVPVMCLANSSEHLTAGNQKTDRPQMVGFGFNGYATVVYDYAWNPLARLDHYGYFDGSTPSNGSVTGDNLTYSLGWYNEVKFNTAAMRYLRYLSASEHGKYAFDSEAIGVFGNSKGGWMTVLGEEHPELIPERRIVPGYDGSTRYENGKTETVGVIDGGETQPWLTYNGVALDSGADLIYASCGGGSELITENHCPTFISCNTGDGSCYATSNQFVNVCRSMDVPALWFEVDKGHMFTYGPDNFYGVDTYLALFTFANYYLRGDAVSVIYADRDASYGGIPTNAPIVVKFSGAVSAEEVAKITVTDGDGNAVNGRWSSKFGNTEWTLETGTLLGDKVYTLTVPADICGDNGKPMGKAFTYAFQTGYEDASTKVNTVKTDAGTYVYFTVPSAEALEFNADLYTLRLNVANDAVNTLNVYSVSGFNAAEPEKSTVDTLVGSSVITGVGQYDVSLTEYMKDIGAGTSVAFLIKTAKTAGETVVHTAALAEDKSGCSIGERMNYEFTETPDGKKALKIYSTDLRTDYENNYFYPNPESMIADYGIVKGGNLAMSDVGRTFRISVDVYDTVSRIVTLKMRTLSGQAAQYCDYNAYFYNFETKANEWVTLTYEYTVYEPLIGNRGITTQFLNMIAPFTGSTECPIYIKDITSTEIVTDVDMDGAEFLIGTTEQRVNPLITPYGVIPDIYEDEEKYPYVLFDKDGNVLNVGSLLVSQNGTEGVLSSTQDSVSTDAFPKNDVVLYVRRDVTFDTAYDNFSFQFGNILIDMNGHTFTCTGFVFNCHAKRGGVVNVTVKNGTMLQGTNPLITYQGMNTNKYPYAEIGIREFNFRFEDVTFGYAEDATAIPFVNNVSKTAAPVKGEIELVDCTFDLTANAPEGSYTLLNAKTDSNGYIDTHITVKGGAIKANGMDGITVGSGNFEFIRNGEGKYTTLQMPTAASAPEGTYTAGGMGVSFKADSVAGGITTYKLDVDTCWTPYGNVPEQYADVQAYPFVSFHINADGSYTFAKAEANIFADANNLMIDARNNKTVVYMRRDFTIPNVFNNIGFAKDNTFDLGGYTLTVGANTIVAQAKKEWDKHVTYKNGTIVTSAGAFMSIQGASSGKGYGYYLTFDNITFKRAEGSITTNPIVSVHTSTVAHNHVVTYNNCTFDMRGGVPANGMTLFTSGETKNTMAMTVYVNGGEIMLDTTKSVALTAIVGNISDIIFGKYGDKYPTLKVAVGSPTVNYTVNTDEGKLAYGATSTDGTYNTYELFDASGIETKYGTVPAQYASAELYPFVQFKVNGDGTYTFMNAELDIFADGAKIMFDARNQNTVILLRRDYHNTAAAHTNLSWQSVHTVLDLDGHTLSSDKVMWSVNAKKNYFTTAFVVKNGTLAISGYPVMDFSSSFEVAEGVADHTYNITFEGITFKYMDGATTKKPVLNFQNGIRSYVANINFNGCTFDMKGMKNGTVLFPAGASDGKAVAHITVNGGKIVNAVGASLTIFNLANSDSTVTFDKYDGKYTTLNIASGVAPSVKINTPEGEMVYTVTDVNNEYVLTKAHTHSYSGVVTAPTCTKGGYTTYTCACGDSYVADETVALGHSYNAVVTAPTCTEGGYTTYTCANCGNSYVADYTEAIGHAYDDDFDADCNNCGEIREVEIPVYTVAEGVCGVNTTWVLTSDGVLTISGNGDTEDYLVNITKDQPYRAYASQITKVVFEDGVTSIGRGAFYGFTAITEVVLPESLIAIHEYAFFGCSALKSIVIPENTTYIGMYAFRKSGLTEMTFANAEGWKFADGTALDVTNVKAFTTEFTYKQTCMRPVYEDGEIIANGVFGNKAQFSWTLSSTGLLTVSGNGAMPKFNVNTTPWYGYRGAIRSVVIEEGITSVGRCSFHTCRAITSVTLPESLETIAEYAFYNCQFLTEATIPANVTRIEIYAFRKCFALKNVTFAINYGWSAGDSKVSATEINSNAADMLTLVNYTKIWTRDVNAEEEVLDPNYVTGGACNTTVKWSLTYIDDTKTKMKLTISGTGAMPKFETAGTPWYGYLDNIVEVEVCEGITEIGRCSFYGLKFVKTATIANTVTAINDYAFNGCFSLKSIEIPASVTYIADTAFTKTGLAVIPTV